MIITFSGMDGAGKSTQIDLLRRALEANHQVTTVWARGGYTPGFEWLKKVLRKLLGRSVPPPGRTVARRESLAKPWIARTWLTLAMLDLALLYGLVVRFRSIRGQVVICDRYLADTELDFSLNFPDSDFRKMWAWKLLKSVVPKPALSFMLLLPVETSMERSKLKDEPFPDSKEVLERRLEAYEEWPLFQNGAVQIDGTEEIELVSARIMELVSPYAE